MVGSPMAGQHAQLSALIWDLRFWCPTPALLMSIQEAMDFLLHLFLSGTHFLFLLCPTV
jgi:hypothetical protein